MRKLFHYKLSMNVLQAFFFQIERIAENRLRRAARGIILRCKNGAISQPTFSESSQWIVCAHHALLARQRWNVSIEYSMSSIRVPVDDDHKHRILLANSHENNGASPMRFRRYTSGESMIEPDKCRPPSFGTFHGERPPRDTVRISKSRRTSLSVQFPGLLPVRRTTCRYTPS